MYLVFPDGDVDDGSSNYVYGSYGTNSPGTNSIYYGWWVDASGFSNGGYGSISSSYGFFAGHE